jgi:hypothetical protein
MSKKLFYFLNKFLYFHSCNYKLFMKIHHVSSPFICLMHSRKACGQVIFFYQKSFSFIKCSPNCFDFFVNFNIFQKKGSICSKHSKNKNTYTFLDFNSQMPFYIIIVLNL